MTDVVAQMPGTIIEIHVNVGDEVTEEQEVMTLESMKMENPVFAPCDGKVTDIKVKTGDKVATDQVLLTIA